MDNRGFGENICYCRRCNGIVYIVRKGDTIFSIAGKFGVTVNDILNENKFINVYNIQPGDKICIPINILNNREDMNQKRDMEMNQIRETDINDIKDNEMNYEENGAFEYNEVELPVNSSNMEITDAQVDDVSKTCKSCSASNEMIKDVIDNNGFTIEEFVNYLKKFDK